MVKRRALGAMLITAPSDTERVFDLAVRVARAEIKKKYVRATIAPWVRIHAHEDTGEVTIACGLKARRVRDDSEPEATD